MWGREQIKTRMMPHKGSGVEFDLSVREKRTDLETGGESKP